MNGVLSLRRTPILTKEGWKSLVPEIRQEPYKSEAPAKELKVGDFILKDGEWEEIKEIKVVIIFFN